MGIKATEGRLTKAWSAAAGVLVTAALVAAAMTSGLLRPVDDGLAALRFSAAERPAPHRVTVVEIDVASLRAAGRWPWGRERFATAIRNLRAAGADLVGFDVDFSAASSAESDRSLQAAVEDNAGGVVLPTFVQPAAQHAGAPLIENSPLRALTSEALLASVNVPVDPDGRVRRYNYGFGQGETWRQSMASLLVNGPHGRTGTFLVDFGIPARDVDRLSFQDVYENRFDKTKVRGRSVLIGATALELGDEFSTPQAGVLPGVIIHALAAESLASGRALMEPGPAATFALALLLILYLHPGRARGSLTRLMRRHLIAAVLVLAGPAALQAAAPISLQAAPLALAQALCIVWATRRELARRAEAIVREREAGLLHLAMHEPETELPNRRALLAEISTRLAATDGQATAVVALGLDRYDTLRGGVGYSRFNLLVREVAERVVRSVFGAKAAHLSTSVLGLAISRPDLASLQAEVEGLAALDPAYRLGEHPVDAFVRVGVAYARPGDSAEQLLEQASIALDEARRGDKRLAVFDAATFADPSVNLSLMSEMRAGLAAGDLSLHYQPKVDARTGMAEGLEALIRWRHPVRGPIPPDAFIGAAEETGGIRELTVFTVARALDDSARLRAAGHGLRVSVNISGGLMSDPGFRERVLALVGDRGPELCFEITETAVIESPQAAAEAIAAYRAAGLKISIDDYGVGLSSLSYLKALEADELKVDKSLVVSVAAVERDRLIFKSTVDLAHSLGMSVVAEGVETEDVQQVLASLGCDTVQGYLVSRPLPLADVIAFLDGRTAAPAPELKAAS